MNKQTKAIAAVVSAGILWGITCILVHNLEKFNFDSFQLTFVKMFFAAVIFCGIVLVRDPRLFKIRLKDIWMFIGTGILSISLFNICYFYTIVNAGAGVAAILLYTSPAFVMILSGIFFKEKFTLQKLFALLCTFFGCVCVSGFLGNAVPVPALILVTGIGSGFAYALYSIFGSVALKKYNSVTVTLYTFLFSFAGAIPLGKVPETVSTLIREPECVLWSVILGFVCTVLPYFLYTWGLARMESGIASVLVAVEPVVGSLIGIFLYHEDHGPTKILGIVLILSAIVLLSLQGKKRGKPRSEK